ncbi:MAG: Sec-independent protein translocase protein TatB [Pseudomonadota bacterium]|nr:Sec-independent protein translocase protein TatB [Pseudomonadota bacterium]
MFGVDSTELIIVAVAALILIGPKDLPVALRTVGRWVGKVRGMARHFQTGVEAMIHEAELEDMEKKWRGENERIMREFPALPGQNLTSDEPALPLEDLPPAPTDPPGDTPPAPRPPDARELP